MNYESNATNTQFTETEPLIADANGLEHSLSKMANIACEQLEQERRIEDKDGELLRQQNAKLVSGLFQLNKASNKAPDFAAVVKEAMSNAGSNISAAASTAKTTTEDLGSKGWSIVRAKASEATTKVQEVDLTEPVIDAKIALLNTAIQASQLAADVGKRGAALTRQVSLKGAEFGHASEEKFYQTTQLISDRSVVVANSFERLIKFGDYAYELVTDVIKRIARKFSGWVEKTWSDAIYSANLQYSVNLAEKERKRRMTSEDESGAILNALAVSSLVKELAPEFYRPTEEPSRAYAFALLEQKEQRSRIVQERLSGDLSSKAQIVANLIKAHQEGTDVEDKDLPELLPASTTEEVIYPDPMQIFEEPRNIAEELAPIQTLHKKIPEATTMTDSPQALRLAM